MEEHSREKNTDLGVPCLTAKSAPPCEVPTLAAVVWCVGRGRLEEAQALGDLGQRFCK